MHARQNNTLLRYNWSVPYVSSKKDIMDLCNQCLKFEHHSWRGVIDITLCDKVCR